MAWGALFCACSLLGCLLGEEICIYSSTHQFPRQLAANHGVIVVTQSPPDLTKSKGQMVTMDCNLGTVTDSAAWWYKQVPGGIPQFVLFFYHPNSAPTYGSGFSSPKFTSKHTSKSDYSLIINDVEVGDSAVYYCTVER
uniref:Ig-like domain-containing protein n=1 Tax=Denticeps clupeoides TaxID=299321 RepID=A0AAY4D0T7_9TELE